MAGGQGNEFELPVRKEGTPIRKPEKESDNALIIRLLRQIADGITPTENTLFYDESAHITAGQPAELRENDNNYIRERVFDRLGRNAPRLHAYNDGPGTWYIRATHDGNNFTQEFPIYQGENKTFFNVYELRHRSPTEGLNYRITEHQVVQQTAVNAAEKIEIISTDKDVHFTGAIVQNDHEKENLTGLSGNKFMIRAVNIQSKQPLKFNLIFWSTDTFENANLNTDSFIDFVELDMSSGPTFRINASGQYYLNVGNLEIIYEDLDSTRELHVSLQDLSAAAKNAGATGEVQLDIKMSPRL